MKSYGDKNLYLARAAALRRFNNWEANHPIEMDVEEALAGVGALYELIPLESRHREIDPSGPRAMQQALAHLKGS